MHYRPRLLVATAALFAGVSLPAQDLLGVTWNGATVLVNSYTAAVTPLGTGLFGQNCLGRAADGTFWSTRRISTTSYSYTTIDPNTGGATPVFFGADLRGLATGPGNSLYGIRNETVADILVRIDTSNGFTTTIGGTGFDGIQGLALHQGVLYAWDVFAGLLIVDPQTGAATDPFPSVGGPPYQQSLCSHPDGRLLLGGGDSNGTDQLYSVNETNGTATLIGLMTGAVDVRGLEPLGGYAAPLGQGCNGAHGAVVHTVTGRPQPGRSLSSVSTNHAPGSLGVVLFGFSTTSHQGQNLPLLLDPLLGTSNCSLFVSIDASVVVFAGAGTPAQMQHNVGVPLGVAGLTVHMQHACFEPVPGSMSWSNGVTVQIQ